VRKVQGQIRNSYISEANGSDEIYCSAPREEIRKTLVGAGTRVIQMQNGRMR
jgi:hypothetical protein